MVAYESPRCQLKPAVNSPAGVEMTDYNVWKDLLDTYQSLNPWLQFAWLATPFAFVLVRRYLPRNSAGNGELAIYPLANWFIRY